jgi:hypothetical protein
MTRPRITWCPTGESFMFANRFRLSDVRHALLQANSSLFLFMPPASTRGLWIRRSAALIMLSRHTRLR